MKMPDWQTAQSSQRRARRDVDVPADAELLELVARGDIGAFESLFRRYRPRLRRYLGIRTRRPELLDEMVNDTMLVVWRRAGSFDLTSRVSTWIIGIALRVGLKATRVPAASEELASEGTADSENVPERHVAQKELQARLADALRLLSPEQRAGHRARLLQGPELPGDRAAARLPAGDGEDAHVLCTPPAEAAAGPSRGRCGMTERVLQLHANVHRLVDALLPWYVNSTLSREEHGLVTRHLEACAQCRRRGRLVARAARCVRRMRCRGWRIARLFDALRRRQTSSRLPERVWRVAAVAGLVLVTLFAWRLWTVDETFAPYRTLGAQDTLANGSVVVVFDAAARESEMRGLLQSVGARIVGGPTAANGYLLAIPDAARARAIEQLRAARIVKLAEALGGQSPP
jgi:RNA polymerase sigma-70 factor (ECF subfamily)